MKHTLVLLLFLIQTQLFAQKIIQGKIIKVTDGDTVTLLARNNKKIKVRLYGIDCPEKGQDYYQVAKNYVSNQIFGKHVRVEVKNKDRYNRSVGVIWYSNNNLNIDLLKNGLAWHYTDFDKSKAYSEAEKTARLAKRNIWSKKSPTAPWQWRKNKKKK